MAPTTMRARLTTERLLAAWEVIDRQGWDCQAAEALLLDVRELVVRPQVVAAGLHGAQASQAEATGWSTAWEVLSSRSVRAAGNPWGVVTVAVRRAVRGEVVTALYASSLRSAWRQYRTTTPLVSLDALHGAGWDTSRHGEPRDFGAWSAIFAALTEAGWTRGDVDNVVGWIAVHGPDPARVGWRRLAAHSGLAPWRVRRICLLLLGSQGAPGLLETVLREGDSVLRASRVQDALRATTHCSYRSSTVRLARGRSSCASDLL